MQGTQQDSASRQYQTPDDGAQKRLDEFLDGLNGMLDTLINATIQQEGVGSKKFIVNEVMDFVEQIGGATIMGAFMGKIMNKARGASDLKKIPKYKPKQPSTIGDDAATLHKGFKITDGETAKRLQEIVDDPTKYERNMDAIQNYFSRDVTNQTEFNGTHGPALLGADHVPNDQLLAKWGSIDGPATRLTKIENPAQRVTQIKELLENSIQRPFQEKIYEAMLRNPELGADGKTFAESQADKYRPHLNGEPLPVDAYTKGLSKQELDALTKFRGGPEGEASARIQEWIRSFDDTQQSDRLRRAFTEEYKRNPQKVPNKLDSVTWVDNVAENAANKQIKELQQGLLKYPTKFTNLSQPTLQDAASGQPSWKGNAGLEKKYKGLTPKKAQDIINKKQQIETIYDQLIEQNRLDMEAAKVQPAQPIAQQIAQPIAQPIVNEQAALQQAREDAINEAHQRVAQDNLQDHNIVNNKILQQPLGQQIQQLVMAQPNAFPLLHVPAIENVMEAVPAKPIQAKQKFAVVPKAPVFKKGHSPLLQNNQVRQNYVDNIVHQQAATRRRLEEMRKLTQGKK